MTFRSHENTESGALWPAAYLMCCTDHTDSTGPQKKHLPAQRRGDTSP